MKVGATLASGTGRLEMLKMEIDPAMCMKTKAQRQNVTPKTRHFARKCTRRGIIDKNRSGVLAENTQVTR
jgi:hypothetical protein